MLTNTIDDLIKGVLIHGPDVLQYSVTSDDLSKYINRVETEKLNYPIPPISIDEKNWFIPEEYKNFDVEKYCLELCNTKTEIQRVEQEFKLYKKHNFIEVLQAIKYVIDTLRQKNIVWGVGRGSSVASYVLFLLGVHKIDSIKYDIPIEEFFKGEDNG